MSLKTSTLALSEEILVPGSVANLGGGFDTLGVAVELYLRARIVDIRDDGGSRLVVERSTPPVQGENAVERAFAPIVQAHRASDANRLRRGDERHPDGRRAGQQRRRDGGRPPGVRARHRPLAGFACCWRGDGGSKGTPTTRRRRCSAA